MLWYGLVFCLADIHEFLPNKSNAIFPGHKECAVYVWAEVCLCVCSLLVGVCKSTGVCLCVVSVCVCAYVCMYVCEC